MEDKNEVDGPIGAWYLAHDAGKQKLGNVLDHL